MSYSVDSATAKTQQWLEKIIVANNFCPFAKKEMVNDRIHYYATEHHKISKVLDDLVVQCDYLQQQPAIETTLIIFSKGFKGFEHYLDLVDAAEQCLINFGYDGVFQLASFHPDYYFDGQAFDDASNYTNRSPLPILHLLREASIEKVLTLYQEPEKIPENNIALARLKGSDFFQQILTKINRDQ